MPLIPFARESRPGTHSGERLLNYFFQPKPDGLGPTLGRSGLTEYVDLVDAAYAVIEMAGVLYAVTKTAVWRIAGGAATNVGSVSGSETIRVAASRTEIAIVTNGKYYICDGSTTTEYTTGSVTIPVDVTFLRGYFAVIGTAQDRDDALTISSLDDGTTFNALDFVFAEGNPDGLVAILPYRNELVLIGKKTIEFYYLSGATDFPFSANTGAVLERGCLNGATVAMDDNSFFWQGNDGVIYRNDAAPKVISSLEMTDDIKDRTVEQAFTFMDRGHKFYCLRMVEGPSWVMNIATGAWQEFSTGADHGPWIATGMARVADVQYFATTGGKICTQSGYTDDGAVIRAEMVTPPVDNSGEYLSVNKLHVNYETGLVDTTTDPRVCLEVSRDGKTWTQGRWTDLADIGEYFRRAAWHAMGGGRRMQAKLWITDPVGRDMIGGSYG